MLWKIELTRCDGETFGQLRKFYTGTKWKASTHKEVQIPSAF